MMKIAGMKAMEKLTKIKIDFLHHEEKSIYFLSQILIDQNSSTRSFHSNPFEIYEVSSINKRYSQKKLIKKEQFLR